MARDPNWGRVWLEARAAGRNPVAALAAAGLCTAAEVGASEAADASRSPPGEPPHRRLKCHEGLDREHLSEVEAELAAHASPSAVPIPAPALAHALKRSAERGKAMTPT